MHDPDCVVILEALPDRRQCMDDVDADSAQVLGVSNTRDLPQLRATDRTGRQNDLLRRSRGV